MHVNFKIAQKISKISTQSSVKKSNFANSIDQSAPLMLTDTY